MTTATRSTHYLLGIAPAGQITAPKAAWLDEDHPQSPPRVANVGDFDALVIDLPTNVFEGDDAEARLQDIAWLTPRVERHESIVRAARATSPLMPVGFGSVFSRESAIADAVSPLARNIREFCETTRGASEWAIKASVSRADALERARARIASDAANKTTDGQAYLAARRLDADALSNAEDYTLEHIAALIDALEGVTLDAVERDVIDTASNPDRWLIAHVALLVPDAGHAAFDAALEAAAAPLDAEGIDLELSGPWTPYSFCPVLNPDAAEHLEHPEPDHGPNQEP